MGDSEGEIGEQGQILVDNFKFVGDIFRDFLRTKKDLYTAVAALLFDVPENQVTRAQRHEAKSMVMKNLIIPVHDTIRVFEES